MKVLLAHPGTQYAFHLANQLHAHNVLYRFHTGIGFGTNNWLFHLLRILPKYLSKKLDNRILPNVPDSYLRRHILIEIKSLLKLKNGNKEENVLFHRNKEFQINIPEKDLLEADLVIGFDTSSWILLERCRKINKPFILDVSIGHPLEKKKVFDQLISEFPQWIEQLRPKSKMLVELEIQEAKDASLIVVPSQFVKETYVKNNISADKIIVNPFGVNSNMFLGREKKAEKKLHFLFLGSYTARKGLPLLLKAWAELNPTNAILTIAGFGKLPSHVTLSENIIDGGVIIPKNRQQLFDTAHVFIFPSYFEGFAQVQIEAATCGLPLIGTYNSGAEEIIENGINGVLITTGKKEELKKAILQFLDNPILVNKMSINSLRMAKKFTWDNYGKRWAAIIDSINLNN